MWMMEHKNDDELDIEKKREKNKTKHRDRREWGIFGKDTNNVYYFDSINVFLCEVCGFNI